MQVVILAGGFGTRLSEETELIPKPMVRIGNVPILLHIMNYYAKFKHSKFIIVLGYKADVIREYFEKELSVPGDSTWDMKLMDTGLNTSTGGRIKPLGDQLDDEFMLTYGDGLSNVDLNPLLYHHKRSKKVATVTAVRPPARFGIIDISNGIVTKFAEKNPQDAGWINGRLFCLNKKNCSFIMDLTTSFESETLNHLVVIEQLTAFDHHGWWQPIDTLRDKRTLESIWENSEAPWVMA